MINTNMRTYNFYTFGDKNNYGQPQLSKDIKGTVKISITTSSLSIQDNINYKDASYIGLTQDSNINDSYVIAFGDEKLKVLYVNPTGRFKQVFLKEI